jgi:chromosome segregation ATPase
VKTTYTETNKQFIKLKNRIDFLNEELEKISYITPEQMEQYEEQYATKKLELNKYSNADGQSVENLDTAITNLKAMLADKEKQLQEYKLQLNRLLLLAQSQVEAGLKLKENKCPTCNAPYTDHTKLDKTRDEYKDTTLAIEDVRVGIQTTEQTIVKLNAELSEQESKRLAILGSASEVVISKSTLEKELN